MKINLREFTEYLTNGIMTAIAPSITALRDGVKEVFDPKVKSGWDKNLDSLTEIGLHLAPTAGENTVANNFPKGVSSSCIINVKKIEDKILQEVYSGTNRYHRKRGTNGNWSIWAKEINLQEDIDTTISRSGLNEIVAKANEIMLISKKDTAEEAYFGMNKYDSGDIGNIFIRQNGVTGVQLKASMEKWTIGTKNIGKVPDVFRYYRGDASDSMISGENIMGDTSVGVSTVDIAGSVSDELLVASVYAKIIGFGTKTLPTDAGIYFNLQILDKIQAEVGGGTIVIPRYTFANCILDMGGDMPMITAKGAMDSDGGLAVQVEDMGNIANGPNMSNVDVTEFVVKASITVAITRT